MPPKPEPAVTVIPAPAKSRAAWLLENRQRAQRAREARAQEKLAEELRIQRESAARKKTKRAATRKHGKLPDDWAEAAALYFETEERPTIAGLAKRLHVSREHLQRSIRNNPAARKAYGDFQKERASRKRLLADRKV